MISIGTTTSQQNAISAMNFLRTHGYGELRFGLERKQSGLVRIWTGPFITHGETEMWKQKLENDGFSPAVEPYTKWTGD